MSRFDALVIGAGVAGASAALGLARAGASVLLVERAALPRDKVCGCCLNATAIGVLRGLGLGDALSRVGAVPTREIVLCSGGRRVRLPCAGGLCLSRGRLDALLVDAAQRAGCVLYERTTARVERFWAGREPAVRVRCGGAGVGGSGLAIRAGVVLVADGLAGTSTRSIEPGSCEIKREIKHGSLRGYGVLLDARGHGLPGGQVVMRCGSAGYVGTAVLEDGRLDIAAALDPAAVKAAGGPAGAAARVALEAGHPLDDLRALRWRATAPLTGRRRRLALPGVMFLGDAAGYVEPFTGEGMAWALRSAQAAVPIALDAVSNGWTPSHEQRWERAHRDAVRRRQWRCRVFSAVLRRPMLTNAAVAALRCVPARVMPTAMRLALPPVFADAPPAQPMGHRPCV